MGISDKTNNLISNTKHVYTISEAKEVERQRMKQPTKGQSQNWVDVKTGKQVYIGV